jgi:hypothetical protein
VVFHHANQTILSPDVPSSAGATAPQGNNSGLLIDAAQQGSFMRNGFLKSRSGDTNMTEVPECWKGQLYYDLLNSMK